MLMNDETLNNEINNKINNKINNGKVYNFNLSLFLGCGLIALSILIAGLVIARKMPDSLHGNLSGSFSGVLTDGSGSSAREFMSEWEAAAFLTIPYDDFMVIAESGELDGVFAVFEVHRTELRAWHEHVEQAAGGGPSEIELPQRVEYVTILTKQRVFSREKLAEWVLGRMGE
jgi:hypothetical protein